MNAYQQSTALCERTDEELHRIKAEYTKALSAQFVSPALLISIKNLFENLRTALDFMSVDIHQRYCHRSTKKLKISFPYADYGANADDYRASLAKRFDGLEKQRRDLFEALVDCQYFGSKGFTWLPKFIELNNENKHQQLTPQIRREKRALRIKGGGTMSTVNQGGAVVLKSGATMSVGRAKLKGPQIVSPQNLPDMQGGHSEIIIWHEFHFETNNEAVLPLLSKATAGVREIVELLNQ